MISQMRSQSLDAIAATTQPRNTLIRYLLDSYPLKDPHLRAGFRELLEEPGTITQEPYLEGTQPYKPGCTLRDLVEQGSLHPGVLQLFPPDRRLYSHQESAIRNAVDGKNIVVVTGTGSGKTECFSIPMINTLLANKASGVQVLILYPMNALVNDQVKRLRVLLCRQTSAQPIRFGFYTSRTKTKSSDAEQSLREELDAADPEELRELLTDEQRNELKNARHSDLVRAALQRIQPIQALSREEIWDKPPQILVTNYSMLEHMLVRPQERSAIFERSSNLRMVVVDEAHTYSGSTGSEVAILLRRFKAAVGITQRGQIQGIATSASLGDLSLPETSQSILSFASNLLDEKFDDIISGQRTDIDERLGDPYSISEIGSDEEIYAILEALNLPLQSTSIDDWQNEISAFVPNEVLLEARQKADEEVHRYLWFALQGHPLIHSLIRILDHGPKPWREVALDSRLWNIPRKLDGSIPVEEKNRLYQALSNLIQLGTRARFASDELPLVPVRLHLLFRSIEGVYACINPECPDCCRDPSSDQPTMYGRLYLNSKSECESCSAPVLELTSCRKCGTAFATAYAPDHRLKPRPRSQEDVEADSVYLLSPREINAMCDDEDTGDDEDDSQEENVLPGGYVVDWACLSKDSDTWHLSVQQQSMSLGTTWPLRWYSRPPKKADDAVKQRSCCPACGARRGDQALRRVVSFTDAPLAVLLDSLFELLPEGSQSTSSGSKPKILTFSDGRQDAAFFASDFQRTHTENLYRQEVIQAFRNVEEHGLASVGDVEQQIKYQFLHSSIPHPDRNPDIHHRSYVASDPLEEKEANRIDCEKRASQRARELLLREFGLPSARRFSVESMTLLACHLQDFDDMLIDEAKTALGIKDDQAALQTRIFLTVLTDQIRLLGAIDLKQFSNYFQETVFVSGSGKPKGTETVNRQRSKVYVTFEKTKGDKDATQFRPRRSSRTLQLLSRQNRIVEYIRKVFGDFPDDKELARLYDSLVDHRVFVPCEPGNGHQIGWDMLVLSNPAHDWYACPSCQQRFHIPGLSSIGHANSLNLYACPSYKCTGRLKLFNRSKILESHYVDLVQRYPMPLRAAEHTAQLQPDELSKREGRFRRGHINLLSCSTTLEMGVDIGELQVVAMRNFPPLVSNYQQRAGRAGRRTDGVAISVLYGQRRPHDRYFFENPRLLIDGSNKVPSLEPGNSSVQRRHIHAELLAGFLRTTLGLGTEDVTVGDFLGFPEQALLVEGPAESLLTSFLAWLRSREALTALADWMKRLESKYNAESFIDIFQENLIDFSEEQRKDWNALIEDIVDTKDKISRLDGSIDKQSRDKRSRMEGRCRGLESQLDKVRSRRIHEELRRSSILPIYGFPIDVVRLLAQSDSSPYTSNGVHRLELDRRLALSEYAPGQEVIVADRLHKSVGVHRPSALVPMFYWVCKVCNYFISETTSNAIDDRLGDDNPCCPVCSSPIKTKRSPARQYITPRAFITDWGQTPDVTPSRKPVRQPTSQVFLAKNGRDSDPIQTDLYEIVSSTAGEFFLANQGPSRLGKELGSRGYCLCMKCGRDLSEEVLKRRKTTRSNQAKPAPLPAHENPLSQAVCSGGYTELHLAHQFKSDLIKIRFTSQDHRPPSLFGVTQNYQSPTGVTSETADAAASPLAESGTRFWRSLTYAVLAAAAQVLDIQRSELDGLFRSVENDPGTTELIIYDNVASGVGHSKRIAENFQSILEKTLYLASSCNCQDSCYDCLRTYANQPFHEQLDRRLVEEFLRPLVEVMTPDEVLLDFAPQSNRISIDQIPSRISASPRLLKSESYFAITHLQEPFNLALLGSLIAASTVNVGKPVTLILRSLPERNLSDDAAVARRRLSQWVEQGILELYVNDELAADTYCLSPDHPLTRRAFRITFDSDGAFADFLEARSEVGVQAVSEQLPRLRADSRLITSDEIADPENLIIFPSPSWSAMKLDLLRAELGLAQLLEGQSFELIEYSDRYINFRERADARFLVDLLKGPWLNPDSQFRVRTNQTKEEDAAGDRSRLHSLESDLSQLDGICQYDLIWGDFRKPRRTLLHRRELILQAVSGQRHRVLFDKGMDFMNYNPNTGLYAIRDDTYIVATKQL
jgi:ATP-dependent helicase YprA (DUF1998 family)